MDQYYNGYGYGYSEQELLQQQFHQQQQLEQQRLAAEHQQQVEHMYAMEQQQQQQGAYGYGATTPAYGTTTTGYTGTTPSYGTTTPAYGTTTTGYDSTYGTTTPGYSTTSTGYNTTPTYGQSTTTTSAYSTQPTTTGYSQPTTTGYGHDYYADSNRHSGQYNPLTNSGGDYGATYIDPNYQTYPTAATNTTHQTQPTVTVSQTTPTTSYYNTSTAGTTQYGSTQYDASAQYNQQPQQQQQQQQTQQQYNTSASPYSATPTGASTPTYDSNRHSGQYNPVQAGNEYSNYLGSLPLPPPPSDGSSTSSVSSSNLTTSQGQQQQVNRVSGDWSEEWKRYYQQQEEEKKAREESWRQYLEQQKQNEMEQERKRSEELERLRLAHQQEEERLRMELEKQREETERMKEQMRQQMQSQKAQAENEKQNVIVWHQEEFKRQMMEIQKEKELAQKHQEQTLEALLGEQKVLKDQLVQQQESLVQQKQSIQSKLQMEEQKRADEERKRADEFKQRETMVMNKYKELEQMKSQMESKQSLQVEKMNKDVLAEREKLEAEKKKMESENLRIKKEFEAAKAVEERKLKEQQDHIARQKEFIDVQQKELQIQIQQTKDQKLPIDSLQPMRDLANMINATTLKDTKASGPVVKADIPNRPAVPRSMPPKVQDLHKSLTPEQAATVTPVASTARPVPSVPSAPQTPIFRPLPKREYTAQELGAIVDGYKFGDVIRAQRCAKKWISRKKFVNVVNKKFHSNDPETERLKRRYKSVNELYTTEVSYLNSLLILQNFYFIPMEVEAKVIKTFKTEEIQKIFSNLRSLVSISTELLRQLEERISRPPILIGDVFVKLAPIFKIYVEYVNNFDSATPQLKQLLDSEKGKQFFDEQKKKSRSTSDIHSLLIMPVQRIPRYELLLKEILKNTDEDHVEFTNIKTAHEALRSINQYINDRKRNVDNRSRLLDLQKEIKNSPELLASHRYFVKEGPVSIASNKKHESGSYHLFFFNDMILVTKKANFLSSYKFEFVYQIPLGFSDIKDIPEHDSMIRIIVGRLESIDVLIYTISFKDQKEKSQWLAELLKETQPKQNLIKINSTSTLEY